eukprot:TRINITY_DN20632_c0_g1_i1.p1 TRINITY_DN20632_c0_g1~~TRINITY_DN20632_c0_g1_i1.p1  ORF type:complete len:105 (-),score=8.86 TRINITY_DN20632_c0_g1_i1:10-324(-)
MFRPQKTLEKLEKVREAHIEGRVNRVMRSGGRRILFFSFGITAFAVVGTYVMWKTWTGWDYRPMNELIDVKTGVQEGEALLKACLLYTSPSPRDRQKSRMPSSA